MTSGYDSLETYFSSDIAVLRSPDILSSRMSRYWFVTLFPVVSFNLFLAVFPITWKLGPKV